MPEPSVVTAAREQVHLASRHLQQATLVQPEVREANAAKAVAALRSAIDLLTDDD
jgi:hypothetical protein